MQDKNKKLEGKMIILKCTITGHDFELTIKSIIERGGGG